jgi:outer membrane protein
MTFRSSLGAAAAGLMLSACLLSPAGAAPAVDGDQPAFVNLNKILAEYRKTSAFAKFRQRMRDQEKIFGQEMETLAQLRYCTEPERQEALAIKSKPRPNAREQARLTTLMNKANTIDNELATLSQKQNPTPADTQRISDLSKMRTDAARNLAKEATERQERLRKMETDMTAEVEDELLKVVEKVAKDQKLPIIYERRALLFGGVDMTDQVLKKLPK